MRRSVLEAIRSGDWNYEPEEVRSSEFEETDSLPGSSAKLDILAERVRRGLPLWHPKDRHDCEGLFGPAEE